VAVRGASERMTFGAVELMSWELRRQRDRMVCMTLDEHSRLLEFSAEDEFLLAQLEAQVLQGDLYEAEELDLDQMLGMDAP